MINPERQFTQELKTPDLPPEVGDYIKFLEKSLGEKQPRKKELLSKGIDKLTNEEIDELTKLNFEATNILNLIKKSIDEKRIVVETEKVPPGGLHVTPDVFTSPEKESRFFETLRQYWTTFYNSIGLSQLAENLPAKIEINPADKERLISRIKQGYNYAILFPPNPDQYLSQIKEQTEKPMEGLSDDNQYHEEEFDKKTGEKILAGIYLTDIVVKPAFPDKINTRNRPSGKPYLMLVKDTSEVDEETKEIIKETREKASAENLKKYFQSKKLKGYTVQEYFIFQYDYTLRHQEEENPHPDTDQCWNLCLDSDLKDQNDSFRILSTAWDSPNHVVLLDSMEPDYSYSNIGARSSDIFEIKT